MATNSDEDVSRNADKEHQQEKIETLENLTKDYTTAAKEMEMQLTHEFKKKEEELLFQIEMLQQERDQYKSKATELHNQLKSKVDSKPPLQRKRSVSYRKQIQALRQQIAEHQEVNKKQQQMNASNEQLLEATMTALIQRMSQTNNFYHQNQSTISTIRINEVQTPSNNSITPSSKNSSMPTKPFFASSPPLPPSNNHLLPTKPFSTTSNNSKSSSSSSSIPTVKLNDSPLPTIASNNTSLPNMKPNASSSPTIRSNNSSLPTMKGNSSLPTMKLNDSLPTIPSNDSPAINPRLANNRSDNSDDEEDKSPVLRQLIHTSPSGFSDNTSHVKMTRAEDGVIELKQSPSSVKHIWLNVYISYRSQPETNKIRVHFKRNGNIKALIDVIKFLNPIMTNHNIQVYGCDSNGIAEGLLLDHDQIIDELGITNLCVKYGNAQQSCCVIL